MYVVMYMENFKTKLNLLTDKDFQGILLHACTEFSHPAAFLSMVSFVFICMSKKKRPVLSK